jgi:hypothetical protein
LWRYLYKKNKRGEIFLFIPTERAGGFPPSPSSRLQKGWNKQIQDIKDKITVIKDYNSAYMVLAQYNK